MKETEGDESKQLFRAAILHLGLPLVLQAKKERDGKKGRKGEKAEGGRERGEEEKEDTEMVERAEDCPLVHFVKKERTDHSLLACRERLLLHFRHHPGEGQEEEEERREKRSRRSWKKGRCGCDLWLPMKESGGNVEEGSSDGEERQQKQMSKKKSRRKRKNQHPFAKPKLGLETGAMGW
jgi:hypothetical protein